MIENDATPPTGARCVVRLRDLTLDADIGVYEHERGRPQPLVLDVEVEIIPPKSDRLAETLDYDLIARFARTLAGSHILLVETYARRLAELCLDEPGVLRVEVAVRKPNALRNASAGACLTLTKCALP